MKLQVQLGGGAGNPIHDYSAQVRVFNPDGSPAIHGGMRCDDGGGALGEFTLVDEEGVIPEAAAPGSLRLSGKNPLWWIEDAPGYDAWLSVGWIGDKEIGRGFQRAANTRSFTVQWEDANKELDGIVLLQDEVRPAETDVARATWLMGAYYNGDPRPSTVIATHKIAASPAVAMPAKTYTKGSPATDILTDCKETAGKLYAVVIHEDAGADHKCFLYISPTDHTTYASTAGISDDPSQWNPDDPSAPVFEPHWLQGPAAIEANGDQVSGLAVTWKNGVEFVTDATHEDQYNYYVEPFYDDQSETQAQAQAKGAAVLDSREDEHVSHQPSILVKASQHPLIRAGMSITIQSAASMGGQYLGTTQTRRIAEVNWEPAGYKDGVMVYWAHLQLDRPAVSPVRTGSKALATMPKPPQQPTPGDPPTAPTTDYQWHFETNLYDDDTGTYNWGTKATRQASGSYDGSAYAYVGFTGANTTVPATENIDYSFSVYARRNDQSGSSMTIVWLNGSAAALRTDTLVPAASLTQSWQQFNNVFTAPAGTVNVRLAWNTGYPRTVDWDAVLMQHGGTGGTAGDPGDSDQLVAPGSAGPNGELGTSSVYMPIDTALPAQIAGDTPFDNTVTAQLAATEIQSAVDELTRRSWISASDPAVTDDADDGFATGDQWTNSTSGDQFVLTDATAGAAVWTQTNPTGTAMDLTPGTPADVTTAGSPAYFAFPGVALLDASHLVAVVRQGTDHVGTLDGKIVYKIGTIAADKSVTWGSQATVYDDASLDCRDPEVMVTSDGTVLCSFFLYDGTNGTGLRVVKGTWDGSALTWGTPISVTSTFTLDNGCSAKVVELFNGDLIFPFYGLSSGTDSTAAIVRSTDGGDTWGSQVTIATGSAHSWTEPYIVRLPDDTLHCLIRVDDLNTIYRTTSADGGATWAAAASAFTGDARPAHAWIQSGGLLHISRGATGADPAYRTSTDKGVTWSSETVLDTTGTQCEYASICAIDHYTYAVVYCVKTSASDADLRYVAFTDAATNVDLLDGIGTSTAGTVSALDDLSDVTITSAALGDRLRYDGSAFVNSAKRWVPMTIDPAADGTWQLLFTDDGDVYMTEVEG